ncbi:cytochrome o ubiquinol oxidase operon protein cyoD [Pseudoxanthobacter soli DSM 19599]|uniref:Cytochrome bo(3) ubiquinol oxidase subunit 4 n=1 Tax=Pseudoxanthobacter soli DSM 19599 TaxID=1123029 RepID=A0A1M7ZNE2_9HYPH|nr:cytochrome o ubiquinol oxidase subunit IV [Pseudoxanthobacter soli]SHO66424.1 cytochrome o ubiquinol oxidase operon protein cyoD [Pseudoxanthobacter soli DSM 19599]
MTERTSCHHPADFDDMAPGENRDTEPATGLRGYLVGYGLAILLTAVSYAVARSGLIYEPAIVSALVVLAIAQMGVHLVFFLHLTTGPDNTNNVLALAFGVLIVALVVIGSIWIMTHLNHNMMPMHQGMDSPAAASEAGFR